MHILLRFQWYDWSAGRLPVWTVVKNQSIGLIDYAVIELGNNPAKIKAIKEKLERNRLTTALFDTPRFTKHIEAAFTQMYERYQADLPPDHIHIDAKS